ncbi:TAXI family TRAP transporter solute-binding subunit [Kribbella sindirgiensis]|uniref:TAXI family TRAP transporter solute-binding subunit n=1 Tax=Kribbella sindirgiensis TaxID=1124744 RepID=A0A4R0I9B0_9ACTN|nr:TAXI family TRAP transporter solute-binding subunit [Kribbella sindirgiensis]TCC26403.1 TAXI family TRAP transporter solute-binding subunit [Kribbella sindirgiensis]
MERPRLLTPARPTGLTRRGFLGFGAAAASGLLLPGCSRGRADEPAPSEAGVFSTGNLNGVYNKFGTALSALVSEVTGMELKPIVSDGSVDNLYKVAGRKADLGFCTSDSALAAYEGTGEFSTGPLRFFALARVYDNYVHVVVPMASKASKLDDLFPSKADPNRKMVVGVGPKDSGTEIVANMILNKARADLIQKNPELDPAKVDVIRKNLSLEQMAAAVQPRGTATRGSIDAFIWSGGVPTDPIAVLQKSIGFRLLDIGPVAEAIALKEFGGFLVSAIPPSQYGLANSVPTLAVPNFLIAKPNLSDSWAWWTVNTLFRRQNDLIPKHPEAGALDPRSAIATMPVPLHPAAERWYRQNHI